MDISDFLDFFHTARLLPNLRNLVVRWNSESLNLIDFHDIVDTVYIYLKKNSHIIFTDYEYQIYFTNVVDGHSIHRMRTWIHWIEQLHCSPCLLLHGCKTNICNISRSVRKTSSEERVAVGWNVFNKLQNGLCYRIICTIITWIIID